MELLSNSSISNWMFFNETAWNNVNNVSFPPCKYVNWTRPNADEATYDLPLPITTDASCTQVCNDSRSLFGWQDNLATCGLWSTLVYAYNFNGSGADPNRYPEKAPVDLLNSFANVGLDAHDPEYSQWVVSYADVMSSCFVYLYQNVKAWRSADAYFVPGACTRNGLFPYSSSSNLSNSSADVNFNRSASALHACLTDLCSPVALDPELAGVGFVISFIWQSSIIIVAFAYLLVLEIMQCSNDITVAALVNFHTTQCYFASTVQVAALWIVTGNINIPEGVVSSEDYFYIYGAFIDNSALVVLATSGFIPVTFGLATIMRFGHPSWHLIRLSLVTFALATATLATFYHYDSQYSKLDNYLSSLQHDGYLEDGTCAIGGNVGDTVFRLCGSSLLNNNTISGSTITQWWIWAAWANCMVYMLLCFVSKLMGPRPPKMACSKLNSAPSHHPGIKLPGRIMGRLNGRLLIFIVTPALCLSVQFYLITAFNRHHLVSQVWTFGQIIAVAFWLPSVFEYYKDVFKSVIDKTIPEPKYSSPLGAMKDIVQQTVAMANYRPIGRLNHAASSGSDPEAVLLQSLSSAVDSHGTGQEDQQSDIVIKDFAKIA
ncbi:hypothetical protein JMJ35_000152 [Cladonia borealis]|uniref:Uncharacterized protein n=1 Tax=Cladonia borealis TaxID=184061 RepID=A0AA39R8P5_9LECA|nr:hypothetical protein JMJ35_000152 [Cladonia borealis]